MDMITLTAAKAPGFSHRTMTYSEWRKFVTPAVRGLRLRGNYYHVEYLSAPQGLIVLAHERTVAGQVDGLHPVCLSQYVTDTRSIVEPFVDENSGYAVHYLNRRQQGGLVLGAFGRMIDAGDPEAPGFLVETGRFVLEMLTSDSGPIVAVVEDADKVHVIRRDMAAMDAGLAA